MAGQLLQDKKRWVTYKKPDYGQTMSASPKTRGKEEDTTEREGIFSSALTLERI